MDIAIIGAGPAGVSAGVTARNRGRSVCIIGAAPEDSPLWNTERIDNYPGMPSVSGRELILTMRNQAVSCGVELMQGRVLSVMPLGSEFGVSVGADFVQCGAVIIASGLARGGELPGERELLGRGVSYCATCDGMLYRKRPVVVLGFCSEAQEEAEFLRSIGCAVTYLEGKAAARCAIERAEGGVVVKTAEGEEISAACAFILRSGVAADALLPGLETRGGLIVTDSDMRTSVPGVFACGDCTGAPFQIAKAVGEGNIAALSAAKYLGRI